MMISWCADWGRGKTYNISANKKKTSKRLTLLILILCLEKGTWQRLALHCTGGERMNVYTQCVLHMTCNALHIIQCVLIEMLITSCQRSSIHHVYYPWLAMHYTLYNMCSTHDLQCTVIPVGNWKVRFQINFHWEKVKVSDASSTAVSTIFKTYKVSSKVDLLIKEIAEEEKVLETNLTTKVRKSIEFCQTSPNLSRIFFNI